jgi:hypothetical protein
MTTAMTTEGSASRVGVSQKCADADQLDDVFSDAGAGVLAEINKLLAAGKYKPAELIDWYTWFTS